MGMHGSLLSRWREGGGRGGGGFSLDAWSIFFFQRDRLDRWVLTERKAFWLPGGIKPDCRYEGRFAASMHVHCRHHRETSGSPLAEKAQRYRGNGHAPVQWLQR